MKKSFPFVFSAALAFAFGVGPNYNFEDIFVNTGTIFQLISIL